MNNSVQTRIKIGSDICSVLRIMQVYDKYGKRLLNRIFTEPEQDYILSKANIVSARKSFGKNHKLAETLAGRFAAKEAIAKALGTGWHGIYWREVEIIKTESGAPQVVLHGRAKALIAKLGYTHVEISLSHEREYALAVAILC